MFSYMVTQKVIFKMKYSKILWEENPETMVYFFILKDFYLHYIIYKDNYYFYKVELHNRVLGKIKRNVLKTMKKRSTYEKGNTLGK